jgi:hypothetical protein
MSHSKSRLSTEKQRSKKERTQKQRATSRANSLKSTGPRSVDGKAKVALNGLKHGRRAVAATRALWQAMAELGEDPARYRSLLQDILNSYPPENPFELAVCEDITRLRLKLERNQQAQEAKVIRNYQKLESSRARRQREMEGGSSYDALQANVRETGLRRAPDSPAKFNETTQCLKRLLQQLDDSDFSDQTELIALYGDQPTWSGGGTINAFRALARDPRDRELAAALRLTILEEMRDVAADSELYYWEHVEISPAMRRECLAPAADPEYGWLRQEEVQLRRDLERSIRLLLTMQATGRRTARDADKHPEALVEEPQGWLMGSGSLRAGMPQPGAGTTGPLPGDTPEARAITMQHRVERVEALRQSGPTNRLTPEMIRRIDEFWGLTPDDEEPQPKKPALNAGGSESAQQAPVASPAERVTPDGGGSEKAQQGSTPSPGAGAPLSAAPQVSGLSHDEAAKRAQDEEARRLQEEQAKQQLGGAYIPQPRRPWPQGNDPL